MTKSDLVELVASKLNLNRQMVDANVELIFREMINALVENNRIEVRGFGSFEVRSYKAYSGRNPRTGETVEVEAKRLPFFKPGKALRERVRGDGP